MARSASEATGYSSVDPALLCQRCEHGHIAHGSGGRTRVMCSAHEPTQEIRFVVTSCSDHMGKQARHVFPRMDEVPYLRMTEGRCEIRIFDRQKGTYEFRSWNSLYAAEVSKDIDGDLIVESPSLLARVRAWIVGNLPSW